MRHLREILVVDDDEGLRLLIADALGSADCSVAGASSGVEAISFVRNRRPDLMLLDLKLTDMPGTAVLEHLQHEGLSVPFVVITGQGDERVAVEMMKQGAIDYVMKDSGILELLPAVVRRAFTALEREQSLAAAQAERRRLERELLAITERERQRFGADLHDGVGQQLTALELMCVGLRDDVAELDPKLGAQVGRIAQTLRETVSQTRALARGLSPLDEQPEAFQNGLTDLAYRVNGLGGLRCRIEGLSSKPIEDRTAAGHLYRIAQEAVNNAVKHSGATEVVLRWEERGPVYRLEIADNGSGMRGGASGGIGLGIMHYRAGMIGAELTVESSPGSGVSVVCLLPKGP